MHYELFKALHLIFIVTWFAGLFYIVRLFIYHVEAIDRVEISDESKGVLIDQYKLMQKRLWYGITWPSAILTLTFGLSLIHNFFPITVHKWLVVKLVLVGLLYAYHFYCGHILKSLQKDIKIHSSTFLRVFNEVATIFLVGIVFLAVFKSALILGKAVLGLAIFTGVLMLAIYTYKKLRQ